MHAVEAVRNFLTNYSDNFRVALFMWPLFAVVLTLPILAYLYHRDGRLKATGVAATYLAVLYALGIVCFTLYPLPGGDAGPGITYGVPPQWNPFGFAGDIAKDGLRAVFQLAFNVVFFLPLGFICGRLLRMRFVTAVVFAFVVSLLIETAQLTGLFGVYPHAYRCCDVDDLICNTLGGVLGWLCAHALGGPDADETSRPAVCTRPGFVRRCVAFWIDITLVQVAAIMPWLVVDLACELIASQPFCLPGLNQGQTMVVCALALGLAAFAVAEVVVPWRHGGSTPGGMFVRMTFESHERTLGNRVLFYALRILTIAATFVIPFVMVPVLGIFYLAKRCMPYDQVP